MNALRGRGTWPGSRARGVVVVRREDDGDEGEECRSELESKSDVGEGDMSKVVVKVGDESGVNITADSKEVGDGCLGGTRGSSKGGAR